MTFKARVKAFSNFPARVETIKVDADGTVRVYDSIAGYFTLCHSLTERQERRLRKMAQEVTATRGGIAHLLSRSQQP